MIFSELYSVYYRTVEAVLKESCRQPLSRQDLYRIVQKHAFAESAVQVVPSLLQQKWPLLRKDGTSAVDIDKMPLTTLEKQWLMAVYQDPRIRLFTDEDISFQDTEPLYRKEDISYFDQYNDGDDYMDEQYIHNFRLIRHAVRQKTAVHIEMHNRFGAVLETDVSPQFLEYSEKDDKLRLHGLNEYGQVIINLGRIISCSLCSHEISIGSHEEIKKKVVVFELQDERKALERVLLHFAHFEKQAEKLSESRYRITLYYNERDEKEMVIRLLSYGPLICVKQPQEFVNLMKEKLMKQIRCGI